MSYVGFRPSASQTRVASIQVSSDRSASGCPLKSPPPVPPFLRNARRGKTPEGLSRRSGTEPASAAKPGLAQEQSEFWCLSSEQAFRTSRFGEGGDAPANAGTQRRKGVYELRTLMRAPSVERVSTNYARSYSRCGILAPKKDPRRPALSGPSKALRRLAAPQAATG